MIIDEIQADRLRLAPLDPQRLGVRYVEWLNDPAVNQYLESRLSVQTSDSVTRYVADNNAANDAILFGIFEKATSLHIGNIRISKISWMHGHADIGLLIGETDRWGKGYAREAIGSATRAAFETLKLRKLVAGCYVSNGGSFRAFQHCDYREVGRLQAHWKNGDHFDDEILFERLA